MSVTRKETINLKAGETFSTVFNEASMGGYSWSMTENKSCLSVSRGNMGLTREEIGSRAVGAPGKYKISVTPEEPGSYELEFQHKRAWEEEPVETVRFVLNVAP